MHAFRDRDSAGVPLAGGRALPGCVQQPRVPLILAGNGPRSLRFAAARGDGWMAISHWPRTEGVYAGSEAVLKQVVSDVVPRFR